MAGRQSSKEYRRGSETSLTNAIAELKSALVIVDKANVPLAGAYTELAIFFCEEALEKARQVHFSGR